jgi:hypothetical protein
MTEQSVDLIGCSASNFAGAANRVIILVLPCGDGIPQVLHEGFIVRIPYEMRQLLIISSHLPIFVSIYYIPFQT